MGEDKLKNKNRDQIVQSKIWQGKRVQKCLLTTSHFYII